MKKILILFLTFLPLTSLGQDLECCKSVDEVGTHLNGYWKLKNSSLKVQLRFEFNDGIGKFWWYKFDDNDKLLEIEEIKQNTLAQVASQRRTVTADDYLIRALSMPPDLGSVYKALIQKPNLTSQVSTINTLNLYILSQNTQGNLTLANSALKSNLRTYLSQYSMIGDSIEIKDAYIINIGVEFEIVVLPDFNNSKVLQSCIVFAVPPIICQVYKWILALIEAVSEVSK